LAPIAIDAMGADGAPRVEVEGIVSAVREQGIDVIVVGDEPRVRAEIERLGATGEKIAIRHSPEVITMHDAPSMAVKQKKKSSMRMCFDLCKSGEADAVVSAGNSGAMMACGLFVLGRLPGVERPAIVTTFPTKVGECALLDMGANVDPKPTVLAQFAVLGSVYARLLHGKARPKVGLLSNGSEGHKGTALTRDAHQFLARASRPDSSGAADFDYVGYVEGRDIFRGQVDVVVTDGFTGNVVLKTLEGGVGFVVRTFLTAMTSTDEGREATDRLLPVLTPLYEELDPDTYGGAMLLGVDGVCIISHGSSSAKAVVNAVRVGREMADAGLVDHLRAAVGS
jgi:glycerol-3-phosphate acyltransferase PlsX